MNALPEDVRRIGPPARTAIRSLARRIDPRGDRNAVLAVWLSVLVVGSVLFVPAAGATESSGGPSMYPPDGHAGASGSLDLSVGVDGSLDRGSLGGDAVVDANEVEGKGKAKGKGKGKDGGECEGDAGSHENRRNGGKNANGKANGHKDKARDKGKCDAGNRGGPGEGRGGPTVQVGVERADDAPGKSDEFLGPSEARRDRGDNGKKRGRTSSVKVAVNGVQRGETVSMDVATNETEDDDAAFDSITLGVEKPGNFTMRIVATRDPLPGSPAFETADGAEPLNRIRLEHSISNDDVEDVSFTFRVSKARLRATGTDLEQVALYRFADGSWTALPTEPVGETRTHYVFTVDSPGMSEFAIGAQRPEFDLWYAGVDRHSVAEGESVAVTGRVTNVGSASGVFTAELVVDGQVVERKRLTVASGGTRQTSFGVTFDSPGVHEVVINDVHAGTVTVQSAGATEERSAAPESDSMFGWFTEMSVGSMLEWAAGSARFVTTGVVPTPIASWFG